MYLEAELGCKPMSVVPSKRWNWSEGEVIYGESPWVSFAWLQTDLFKKFKTYSTFSAGVYKCAAIISNWGFFYTSSFPFVSSYKKYMSWYHFWRCNCYFKMCQGSFLCNLLAEQIYHLGLCGLVFFTYIYVYISIYVLSLFCSTIITFGHEPGLLEINKNHLINFKSLKIKFSVITF